MTGINEQSNMEDRFPESFFDIATLEDEVRADQLIGDLLKDFCREQIEKYDQKPETAGLMARSADYFLRDFIIADRRDNIFLISPDRIKQFAGNWYIVKNLEPNMAELGDLLEGISAFYQWLADSNRISDDMAAAIDQQCQQLDTYQQRIDTFWSLEGDGFIAWNNHCPIESPST